MNFKINKFVEDAKYVDIYTYEICDSDGKVLSRPTFDFLNKVFKESPIDAQILKSQILQTANKYGNLNGREAKSKNRDWLYALPSKYDEGKVVSRYRLYYWLIDSNTIIIGGGCFKPSKVNGIIIKAYQEVVECEESVIELCSVSGYIEERKKKYDESINEIDFDEIIEL